MEMIKPIRNQVLVKPYPAENISLGGIYVPDSVKKDSNKVLIVAVGNGEKAQKLKAGETVFRVLDWGCEIEVNGEKHFIMDAGAILAKEVAA